MTSALNCVVLNVETDFTCVYDSCGWDYQVSGAKIV